LGPTLGAILGAFIYELFVGIHWPNSESYEVNTPLPRVKPSNDIPFVGKQSYGASDHQERM